MMMDWLDDYTAKRTTAAEAVRGVRSGDRIYIQPGCATPEDLVRALLGRARELENVEIIHLKTLGCAEYSHAQYEGHLSRSRAVHRRERARGGLDGRADYMPIFLHEIEGLFESGECLLDFVFLQVSPPDKFGYVSLGVGVDCTLTAARQARYVIAEVNQTCLGRWASRFSTSASSTGSWK